MGFLVVQILMSIITNKTKYSFEKNQSLHFVLLDATGVIYDDSPKQKLKVNMKTSKLHCTAFNQTVTA